MEFIGQGNKEGYKLRGDQVEYLREYNKDNPLWHLNLAGAEHILPYPADSDMWDSSLGYTYPGADGTWIRDIWDFNKQIPKQPEGPAGDKSHLTPELVNTEGQNYDQWLMDSESGAWIPINKPDNMVSTWWGDMPQQEALDRGTEEMAQVINHEQIHNKLFDPYYGAYPNALKEIFQGSDFGPWYDFGETWAPTIRIEQEPRFTPNPHAENPWQHTEWVDKTVFGPPSHYEKNELATQMLDNMIHPNHPWIDNAHRLSNLNLNNTLYPGMDRPGQGALGYEGTVDYLQDRMTPFYEQIKADAEKGYVQDSIWSTPEFLRGPRTIGYR